MSAFNILILVLSEIKQFVTMNVSYSAITPENWIALNFGM